MTNEVGVTLRDYIYLDHQLVALVSSAPSVTSYSLRMSGDDMISIPPLNLSGDFDLEFAFTAHPGNLSEKYRS